MPVAAHALRVDHLPVRAVQQGIAAVEVGVHEHVVGGRRDQPLELGEHVRQLCEPTAPVVAEVAHRDEPVARMALPMQPRRQPADQLELLLPAGAGLVQRRSRLESLHQEREAVVARAEQPRHRAGRLPERERVPFARELGVVAVAAWVELEHRALDRAYQRDASAFERPRVAQSPVLDGLLEALAHVRRERARVSFGPELGPVGRQPLDRRYENGSGSTALGILISGGP
jgi:hypothetical protein